MSEEGAVGVPAGELTEGCLAQDDRTRLAQAGHRERIPWRPIVGKDPNPLGGRRAGHVDLVFDENHHAMDWSRELPRSQQFRIQAIRVAESRWVQGDDAPEIRSLLIVGFDAIEVGLNQLARCQATSQQRVLDLGNGRLHHLERRGRLVCKRFEGREEDAKKEGQGRSGDLSRPRSGAHGEEAP
jgi:hypothetical protein